MQRIIHTDRLVLRPAYIGDAGRVAQIMEYDISKWLIPVPDPYTLTEPKIGYPRYALNEGAMSGRSAVTER